MPPLPSGPPTRTAGHGREWSEHFTLSTSRTAEYCNMTLTCLGHEETTGTSWYIPVQDTRYVRYQVLLTETYVDRVLRVPPPRADGSQQVPNVSWLTDQNVRLRAATVDTAVPKQRTRVSAALLLLLEGQVEITRIVNRARGAIAIEADRGRIYVSGNVSVAD